MLSQVSIRVMAMLVSGVLAASLTAQPAQAQTMYRCGSTYQDTPCQNAPANKTLSMSTGPKSAAPVSDVQCAGRGAEALKLTWQREAGKTLEQQLTGVTNPTQRALVEETYSIRGSAPEVRSAIEQACLKRKEEALKAAALLEAARATDGAARPASVLPGSSQPSQAPAQTAELSKSKERADATERKAQCDNIQTQLNRVKDQQRQGGSIAFQEELNAQRRDLERRAGAAKC